jgi:membrane carboxypeptidase/penicillin-binding protein
MQKETALKRERSIAKTNLIVSEDIYEKQIQTSQEKSYASSDADISNSSDNEENSSSYVEGSSTLSSDASEFQKTRTLKKRKTKLYTDYLVSSNADNNVNLDNNIDEWVLSSGFNFSQAFIKRRNTLVEECDGCEKVLKDDEELAINGIVLLDSNVASSMINDDNYVEACNELQGKYLEYKSNYDDNVMNQLSNFCQVCLKYSIPKI